MKRQYVTTAIDYPNAAPHMGHVLEKVLADVCVRWMRLRGDAVQFQIGTDEHGIKIQRTAEKEGVSPQELVDRNVPLFQELYKKLGISADRFVRTTDRKQHWPTVSALWQKLVDAGMLEKRAYTGLYCSGCERFMTKRDLEDGMCPIHKVKPEEVTEENWFFLMSRDTENLRNLLTSNWGGEEYRIVPKFRENETLALIDQGLEDVSFSRPTSSLAWGIPVPGDKNQTMYVWCDALTNYISGLGLLTDHEQREWWDDAEVTHVIGKDIARFHALIWPSMLHAAGVRIPDRLLIHGFLTSEGEKMSKSLGNVVMPGEVLAKFGGNPDPLRFYLSHEVPVGNDGDFSWKRIEELYDARLRNAVGNLLQRVLVLLNKEGGGLTLIPIEGASIQEEIAHMWKTYEHCMNTFDIAGALEQAMELAGYGNGYIDAAKPWAAERDRKIAVVSLLAEVLRHLSLMLLPVVPDTACRIATQLGLPYADAMKEKDFVLTDALKSWGGAEGWAKVSEPKILFPPLES